MRQMMESYEKCEYCELAAWGYGALADAIANGGYPIEPGVPTQLICGTEDKAGSAKRYNKEWAADGLPIVWVEGAGHNSNTDTPIEVNETIERFIEEL